MYKRQATPSPAPSPNSALSGSTAGSGAALQAENSRILIAYYSWADNAALAGDVDATASPSVLSPGNVQQLAGWIQEQTGGDLFSIRVLEPYPSGWDDCLDRANRERGENARPQLAEPAPDLSRYDTVFLGYPNWWYGVPMALLTFLESGDFAGKQVYLFCSHGTGGLARSVEILSGAIPDATISQDIFDCYEQDAPSSQQAVQGWAAGLGFDAAGAGQEGGAGMQGGTLQLTVNGTALTAELADNSSAQALADLLADGPLTVELEDYAGMEKVGSLGVSLPRNDEQITTGPGDLILYQGSSFALYYDTNSWELTRLGRLNGIAADELRALLGDGNVSVTLSIG